MKPLLTRPTESWTISTTVLNKENDMAHVLDGNCTGCGLHVVWEKSNGVFEPADSEGGAYKDDTGSYTCFDSSPHGIIVE